MRALLFAALVPAALSAQDAARQISLTEAVQLARQNSPQMISARNNINANEATVRTRWSAFLPTFSGSIGSSWGAGQVFDNKGDIVTRNNITPWNWSRRLSASSEASFQAGPYRQHPEVRLGAAIATAPTAGISPTGDWSDSQQPPAPT